MTVIKCWMCHKTLYVARDGRKRVWKVVCADCLRPALRPGIKKIMKGR